MLSSCLSTPDPAAASLPDHEANLLHFAGDSLSGPLVVEGEFVSEPDEALDVRIKLYFLESFPKGALTALAGVVAFHATDGRDPVRAIPASGALARIGFGSESQDCLASLTEDAAPLATYETVLPAGVTLAAQFRSEQDAFAMELGRTGNSVTPALVSYAAESTVTRRDVSLLASREVASLKHMALIVPVSSGGALLWSVELLPAGSNLVEAEIHLANFAACIEEVQSASATVLAGMQPLGLDALHTRRLSGAVSALGIVRNHRPALIFLASQAGAPAARDVAWLADDEFLAACIQRVLNARAEDEPTPNREQTAWRLERACYRELAVRFGSDSLVPELVSVLFRHAGELGRYPGLLDDVLVDSGSSGELGDRLRRENLLFLDDRNPAARVRAFDWLEVLGAAPSNYDPLADRADRRAALAEASE